MIILWSAQLGRNKQPPTTFWNDFEDNLAVLTGL